MKVSGEYFSEKLLSYNFQQRIFTISFGIIFSTTSEVDTSCQKQTQKNDQDIIRQLIGYTNRSPNGDRSTTQSGRHMATGRLRNPDAIWRPAGYIWRQIGYTTWSPYGDRSATQPGRTPYGDRPVTYGDRSATQPSRHMATGPLLDWVTIWQSVRCETGSPYDDQLVIRLGRHMATGLSQTRIVKRRPRRYKLMHSRLILVFSPLQTKTVLSLIPLRLELSLKFYDKNLEDFFLSYKFRSFV